MMRVFGPNSVYRPGNWGGLRICVLDDEEEAVHGLFKTFERLGIVKRLICIKYDRNILFCVDEVSVNESHEEFKARFKSKK